MHKTRVLLSSAFYADTTVGNVKSMMGWKAGAERGFRAIYPDLIHAMSRDGDMIRNNDRLGNWYLKVRELERKRHFCVT